MYIYNGEKFVDLDYWKNWILLEIFILLPSGRDA